MSASGARILLTPAQRAAWLRLIRTDNVGPVTFRQLLNRFGSAEAALEALPTLARRANAPARIPSQTEIEDELARVDRFGGRIVASGEADYPPLLRFISAYPPLLTMVGGQKLDWSHTVGIVGARNASSAGQKMTQMLAADLGAKGFTIISGLARGIDAAAHRASLSTGTVAVLAGGLDHVYPDENRPLARQILDAGGALVTEMPVNWQPRAQDFPRRNRLVSGISLGIVVVEAAKRSGSLITARLALEQNREVFAVPGSPLDPRAEGGNLLIQQGAHLVTNADDIVEMLSTIDPVRQQLLEPDWTADPALAGLHVEPSHDDRSRLVQALSYTPTPVDDLIATTGLSVPAMQSLLLELDLAGRLEWSAGQLVTLKA